MNKEQEPIKEILPYQVSCQKCSWKVDTEDLELAILAGNNHYDLMISHNEIHQIWYGLKDKKPE